MSVSSPPPNDIILILVSFADLAADTVLNRKQAEVLKTDRGAKWWWLLGEPGIRFSIFYLFVEYSYIDWKTFSKFVVSLGTDILMKVFSLLSLGEISQISKDKEKAMHSSPCMVIYALLRHIPYGCGVLFICPWLCESLSLINEIASHLNRYYLYNNLKYNRYIWRI